MFENIRKYHVSVFSTNIFAVSIALFFVKSYLEKGVSFLPIFLYSSLFLSVFIGASSLILGARKLLPEKNFMFVNIAASLVISLFFMNKVGFLGLLSVNIFAFLLHISEHIIQGDKLV